MGRSQPQPEEVEHLVLVIHGVGDPQPGETLSLFARSVASERQPLTESQEILWLSEKTDDPDNIKTFGSHLRHLDFGRQQAVLAEVFWGDLSRVRRGLIGAVLGLVEILFGLRYVSYVAGHQAGVWARGLQQLGVWCANILHGPVLAVTFFLGLLTLALAGTELLWKNSYVGLWWGTVLACGGCSIAIFASSLGKQLTKNKEVQNFWLWVHIIATFVSLLILVKIFYIDHQIPELTQNGAARPGLIWYCRVLINILALLWLVEMLVIIGMGLCWLGASFGPRCYRTSLNVAFLLPALVVGFWGFVLPMIWLSAAKSLREVVELKKFEELFEEAVPLLGVQFIMVIIATLAAVFVLLRYARWRVQMAKKQIDLVGDPPRLIIHPSLQWVTSMTTIAGVSLVATISVMQHAGWHYQDLAGGMWLAEANKYATGFLVPMGLFAFMIFPHLRPVIDIVLDVTNHFYFRPVKLEDTIDDNDYDIRETTFENSRFYFSRRDAIHLRIKRLLGHLRDKLPGRPKLTVISHSQGTMIAVEVLNDPELSWLNSSFAEVRLVTMGSPLTHLYQHYFRNVYPPLKNQYWKPLRSRISRWVNIFRMDDFVGTRIHFPDLPHEACVYSNHILGPRGHLNYWTDIQVLDILHRELLPTEQAEMRIDQHRRAA